MSEGVLDLEDLEDFFEEGFTVTSNSDTQWVFDATSGDFAGYTVTFNGTGLAGVDDFPDGGTISEIVITDSSGVVADITGLDLAVATLLDEFDLGGTDDDGEDDGDDIFAGDDDDSLDGSDNDDHIDGGGGDDDVDGGDGDDDLNGDDGDDDLFGGSGDDDLSGDDGNDDLFGGTGNDDLFAGLGADVLRGATGIDRLFGGAGRDMLAGQDQKDVLNGGAGNDRLNGGTGNDRFVFADHFGSDLIIQFVAGHDKLDFRATGLGFDDLTIVAKNGDVVIACDEGRIVIDKLVGTLHESDFLF